MSLRYRSVIPVKWIAGLIVIGLVLSAHTTPLAGGLEPASQTLTGSPLVGSESGRIALGLALRRLDVSGTFMQTSAHPDDEHNALFAMFTHGRGLRSICVQTTRGGGGQNEIGPELFQEMAVLRTSELLTAHRLDGAEEYFTRAIDFGYSFDPNQVIEKWGRDEIVGDFVRLIRELRPDVVLTMNIQGGGGDRAHEATTVLTREAYRAAADPARFPDQLKSGLRPWQPAKLYFTTGFGFGGPGGGRGRGGAAGGGQTDAPAARLVSPPTGAYDPLLGRTYAEIGSEAHSAHKCQGMGGLRPLPGGGGGRGGGRGSYRLIESTTPGELEKDESSLFDGVDTTLAGVARFAGANPPAALTGALSGIVDQAHRAQNAFASGDDAGTAGPVAAGLAGVRSLHAQLASMSLTDQARYEIDFRLNLKERDFEEALLAAHGVTLEALADDGLVIRGQPLKVSMLVVNHGPVPVSLAEGTVTGLDGAVSCAAGSVKPGTVYTCSVDGRIPANAALTTRYWTDEYWGKVPPGPARDIYDPAVPFGVPFRPTPFRARFKLHADNADVVRDLPIQFRYVKDLYAGEKRMEVNVVPAFSVRATPSIAVIPLAPRGGAQTGPLEREVHVSVTNGTKGPARASVTLDVPSGWNVMPASAPLEFEHEDEALSARFQVVPPPQIKHGAYTVRAVVTSAAYDEERFASGYQEIEYPHVERRQVIKPAEVVLKAIDVSAPSVRVGYIAGAGDQVPPAIEQLGATLTFIESDELAWGDLSKYDVIMTGVRAYERRADLRAYNRRVLDYAQRGGTVIVQYCKMEFNQAQYGPYPAKVSPNRVTDANAPVNILVPNDPVFTYPNRIGPSAWQGWVQERGLYFLGQKDSKYVDLVSMQDPFPDNPGVKTGALVEARVGKGRWMYVGLGLWRQLPAGTDGAYQLLANLLSLPKAPPAQ